MLRFASTRVGRPLGMGTKLSDTSKPSTVLSSVVKSGILEGNESMDWKGVQEGLSFPTQFLHTGNCSRGFFTPKDDITFWGRTLRRLGFTDLPKSMLKQAGVLIYMKVADSLDYSKFFNQCCLPDTYASWFIVVELHVWLICTRLMQDGKEGQIVRNALIQAMWDDNDLKSKKLEGALSSARRKELMLLNEQFRAAMIGYDEGLLGDDYILAGALWRRFLRNDTEFGPVITPSQQMDDNTHEKLMKHVKALEMLVLYIRSHYTMLNSLSREQLLKKRAIKFHPFDDSLYQVVSDLDSKLSIGKTDRLRMR